MEMLRWKTRIAVLWVLAAVAMAAHTILMVFVSAGEKGGHFRRNKWGPVLKRAICEDAVKKLYRRFYI